MTSEIEIAKEIICHVSKTIKRIYWTNEEIDKWFGKRSAKEIIENGTSCFMNPCSDLALVSSYLLSKAEIPHRWVIEEYFPTEDFDFNRLHFVLEFGKKVYGINYKRNNEAHIFKGKYEGRNDLPIKQIIRIPDRQINLEKSLYENISDSELRVLLKDFSLEGNINRLKKDNSIEKYKIFKKIFGEHFEIKLI